MAGIPESTLTEVERHSTELGELVLRSRCVPALSRDPVFEIVLDDEFLMSSLVTDSEVALARLGLAAWGKAPCDVLVCGLGLGCTAKEAIETGGVKSVTVIELLPQVIRWHQQGLVPLGKRLTEHPGVQLVQGDFFAWIEATNSHGPPVLPASRYDVILVDIDHSSHFLLDTSNAAFYSVEGLSRLRDRLKPGGVFAFWSSDHQENALARDLGSVFAEVEVHPVCYYNPLVDDDEHNLILVAKHNSVP